MSGAQSLLIASGGVGAMAVLVLSVLRPWVRPRHAAPVYRSVSLADAYRSPGFLPAPVPVTVDGCTCRVQSGEHKLWCGELPVAEVEDRPPWDVQPSLRDGALQPSGDETGVTDTLNINKLLRASAGLPPPLEAVLRRELHHVDAYEPGAAPAPEAGAGDESEACGPPAPPAPPDWQYEARMPSLKLGDPIRVWLPPRTEEERARDALVENARVDAFIAEMRADMAAWLASARERWAAA